MYDTMPPPVAAKRPGRRWLLVVSWVLTVVLVGAGAYFLGHQQGQEHPSLSSADVIRQQQSAEIDIIVTTNRKLAEIEQNTLTLVTGKSGVEIDKDAFYGMRTQYSIAYDVVLGEMGRVNTLFNSAVRADFKVVSQSDSSALRTMYPGNAASPELLAHMSAKGIAALVVKSHAARKAQWAALRKFSSEATAQTLSAG